MYGSEPLVIGCAELCVNIVGPASDRNDLDLLENCSRRAEPAASTHQGDSALAVLNRRFERRAVGITRHAHDLVVIEVVPAGQRRDEPGVEQLRIEGTYTHIRLKRLEARPLCEGFETIKPGIDVRNRTRRCVGQGLEERRGLEHFVAVCHVAGDPGELGDLRANVIFKLKTTLADRLSIDFEDRRIVAIATGAGRKHHETASRHNGEQP